MKTIFTVILCAIVIPVICFSQPRIITFSPTSAAAGTTVNISGTYFSASPIGNIVYFGAVRATVLTASLSYLTVQVPTGATYSPITVTVNGLTGYSQNYFSLSYAGGAQINNSSFSNPVEFTTDLNPNGIVVADFDGDGKADLATPNHHTATGQLSTISILRNISTASGLAMAPKLDLMNGAQTYAAASGDIDGDGKPDIVACSIVDQNISIFRNTSTVGNINFAPKVNFGTGSSPQSIAIGDIDGDGKPDIVVVNTTENSISLFRNTTTGSNISFAAKIDFSTQLFPRAVVIADFDGDEKTDIAVSNNLSFSFSIFKNMSTAGNIVLGTVQNIVISNQKPVGLVVFDFNADNKLDLGVLINEIDGLPRSVCQLYRNTSTVGAINFSYATNISAYTSSTGYYLSAADINGDGKVDLALPVTSGNFSNAFENNTSSGSSTASFLTLTGPFNSLKPYGNALADLNGDNKPEFITTNFIGSSLSVFENKCGLPAISSASPNINVTTGSTVTIIGSNFTGTTAVSFGGFPASSFTVVSSTKITAVVANGGSGSVTVTNGLGSGSISGFTYNGPPAIASFSPVDAGVGQSITINGSFTGTVTAVSFGGVPAASFTASSNKIIAVTGNGATGDVSVTTNLGTTTASGFTFFVPPSISTFSPTSGFTGTVVNISGNNFTGATGIQIGGRNVASFTVLSPTNISAVVGDGATGSVAVTTPGGTALKDTFHFPSPSISSVFPLQGTVGNIVTISGTNFSNTPANNVVYFGAAKATVISASNNALTVTVPSGTTYEKILVSTNGAAAYSKEPFRFVFAGVDSAQPLSPFSYKAQERVYIGDDPYYVKCADLDGDGKTDQVIASYSTDGKVVVLRNTSSNGNISFSAPIDITQSYYNVIWIIKLADLNQDGKIDVVIGNSTVLWAFINTSTPGNISFAPYINIATPSAALREIITDDFDGDGKTDIATRGYLSAGTFPSNNVHMLSIYRNVGINGNASFSRYDKTLNGTIDLDYINSELFTSYMLAGDFDNDKKTDFIVRSALANSLVVIRNQSTIGNMAFDDPLSISISGADVLAVADLDNDARPDLVGRNRANTKNFVLLQNTTNGLGNFAFTQQGEINNKANLFFASVGELTGDGRVDIVTKSNVPKSISIYRNRSGQGTISFDTANVYTDINGPNSSIKDAVIADVDGDGKSEVCGVDRERFSVFKNKINDFVKTQLCPPVASTSLTSGLTGTVYQWKVNTGSGSFANINDNANYSGTNTSTLSLNNISSSWYGYQYVCVANNGNSTIFSLQFTNTWTGAASIAWESPANWSCGVVPDNNTDVFINSGTVSVNSNTTIRSLVLQPGVNFSVLPNVTLTILR